MTFASTFVIRAGLALALVSVACRAPAQEAFEGVVTFRMVSPTGKESRYAYYQKGRKTREEIGDGVCDR
jgi:hypothetical protein